MKNMTLLDSSQILKTLNEKQNPFWSQYHAFYSSWYDGVLKKPGPLLLLPFDDHMVHRGDGVFEALKSVDRRVFMMKPHLERLARSAQKISLPLRFSIEEMSEIILQTLKVADVEKTLIRVFLSRGPGGFTTNPYDSAQSQFYVVITDLKPLPAEKYSNGVSIGKSAIPVKESWMAQVKSCNYLPNVMMKKESVDRGLDFTVGFDQEGFLAESSTENIVIVDRNGILTHPPLDGILKGTTMTRCFELAKTLNIPTEIRKIAEQDILQAQEVLMVGTTLDALPVTQYEGQKINQGKVGEIAKMLKSELEKDMKSGDLY